MQHSENIDSSNFGLTDYAVFICLLFVSSGIGIYYAIKVSLIEYYSTFST